MFEREIKFIYDFNLNKINKLGPYFTYEQLTTVGLHPAILNYISAELNYIIFEDRQKLLKNSIFDYSGETITHYFNLITEEVRRTKRISYEYVSKLILHASSFNINYLVRPNWTLLKFVFDEAEHKTANEIKQILNYLYYYNYLRKILVSYLNSKKIISINSQEFEELLKKVDKLGVETYLQSILSTALKSMAEFFNIGEVQKNKISLQAIDTFLEEKKLFEHKFKLIEVFGDDKSQKLSIKDIQKTLNFVMLEKQEDLPLFSNIKDEMIEEPFEPLNNDEVSAVEEKHSDTSEEITDEIENIIESEELIKQHNKSDEEISISSQPQKYRIKIENDIEIEPVTNGETENPKISEDIKEEMKIEDQHFIKEKKISDEYLEEETLAVEAEIPNEDFEEKRSENNIVFEEEVDSDVNIEIKNYETQNVEADLNEKEYKKDVEEPSETNIKQNEEEEVTFSNFAFDIPETIKSEEYEDENEDENELYNDIMEIETSENNEDVVKGNEEENMLKSILNVEEDNENIEIVQESTNEQVLNESEATNTEKKKQSSKIDLSELLEHKDMTRIIEVIFDYDIEEFASTLEEISASNNIDDAIIILNRTLKNHNVSRSSKEAEAFKSIISEYYNRI